MGRFPRRTKGRPPARRPAAPSAARPSAASPIGLDPAQVTYRATRSGQTVALQVTYRYAFASGLVSQAFGGSPTLTLTANSTMRTE